MKFEIVIIAGLLFGLNQTTWSQGKLEIGKNQIPGLFRNTIEKLKYDLLGGQKGEVAIQSIDKNTIHVLISFHLSNEVLQDDWQAVIKPAFMPTFNWAPHLSPTDRNIIAQHVFRQPALILSDAKQVLIVIPDVDILNEQRAVDWYLDMDAPKNVLTLGMSKSRLSDHVIYERREGAVYSAREVQFGFYIKCYTDRQTIENPFRKVASFFWSHWGSGLLSRGNPSKGGLEPYVRHTYNWAFNSWEDQVWQQFDVNGKQVGAPAFIVNVKQSPNFLGVVSEREFRSIWNQAWFSSLRSASGLYRYAKRTGNEDLKKRALMTKELALSFPKNKGFFYGLTGTEMEQITIDGKVVNRSKGWNTLYWGNSNRNPYTGNPKASPFHILDMSWTAYLMLEWYVELEKDHRLLQYAKEYADSLINLQYANGFFPSWVDTKTLKPFDYLTQSSETSMSVTFLATLYKLTKIINIK